MSSYVDWQGGVSNRNYHILKNLLVDSRVNKILAIDYLPWSWKQFLKSLYYCYWLLPKFNKEKKIKHLFLANLVQLDKNLYVLSAPIYFLSKKIFYKQLKNELRLIWSTEKYICWSCNPIEVDYFQQLVASLYVFDAIDNWLLHPSYQKIQKLLSNNYKTISSKSDIIFTVANELQNLFAINNNVHWIPNGIDLSHYQFNKTITDRSIADLPRPIIGYIGVILERLDWSIIEYLAEHNPEKSIVLVGAYKGRIKYWDRNLIEKLKKYSNIYLLGFVSYQQAPSYIQQFDIGIIPHRINTYVSSTNPMKMYEYLACGKPIVATPAPGLNMFPQIKISSDPVEFNRLINEELRVDNKQLQDDRRQAVSTHSWQNRVDKILNLIYERLN